MTWSGARASELSLPGIFGDHMVLQREQPVSTWGGAVPGARVELEFRGKHFATRADERGRWRIELPAMPAGGPYELIVRSSAAGTVLHDVFVGEVWLAAGQSNMAFGFRFSDRDDQREALRSLEELNLRSYAVARIVSGGRLLRADDRPWTLADAEVIGDWSAVAVYFSRALHPEPGVAIGIIDCSQGSSTIEAWMSETAIEEAKAAGYVPREPFEDIRRHYRNPSVLHRSMLAGIIPYGIRGVLWYQGESNASDAASYELLLPAMIRSWRALWQRPELPFLFAQLPAYEPPADDTGRTWALFRAAQARVSETVPGTGMAVLTDTGEKDNIHPADKKVVGERLALLARALVYGEDVEYSGPIVDSVEYDGDRAVLHFRHADGGLVVKGDDVLGVAVRGTNGNWREATAEVQGERLVLWHPRGDDITAVRHAWANAPAVNLYNDAGFPAAPFKLERRAGSSSFVKE